MYNLLKMPFCSRANILLLIAIICQLKFGLVICPPSIWHITKMTFFSVAYIFRFRFSSAFLTYSKPYGFSMLTFYSYWHQHKCHHGNILYFCIATNYLLHRYLKKRICGFNSIRHSLSILISLLTC